jgi:hypothetical protein
VGIDPGWDYNPGQVGRLNKTLELAAEKLAGTGAEGGAIVRELTAETLETWAKSPKADFPIGMMNETDAARIGGKTQLVRLSPDTIGKQLRKHPELTFEEYSIIQDALDRGESIQDGAQALVYLLEEEGYVTVVKATKSGKAVFMTSFRRLSSDAGKKDREVLRLRRRQK